MEMQTILIIYCLFWDLLILVAAGFLIFAIDDLMIDILYWTRAIHKKIKYRHRTSLTYEVLTSMPEKRIAIMVASWKEADVIGMMLRHNLYSIDYQNYDIFVGVYPNDKETIAAVLKTKSQFSNIHCVIGSNNGPTNKAHNLNIIYAHISAYEAKENISFDLYVFHDSEDIIHPLSLKIYNFMSEKSDMIQVPVLPLPVNIFSFTHWIYADEFAENHTKDMVVRERIKGLLPSAGVGTAFTKNTLLVLSKKNQGSPFSTSSLTEDYRTSLTICNSALKQVFITQTVLRTQWKKRFGFFGQYVPKIIHERIATRALFPEKYIKSVRQKTRWITGIAFQEWRHSGWQGSISTKFTLLHDRKALFSHLINGLGYITFLFWLIYSIFTFQQPEYPTLQELLNQHPFVWWIIIFATFVMCERLIQRMIAVTRVYGFLPALFVIPRSVYANILNMHALLKAYKHFFFLTHVKGTAPKWDKTDNQFKDTHALVPFKKRLGDMLLEKKLITREMLNFLLLQQQKTGLQLGHILLEHKMLNSRHLRELLAEQYHLETIEKIKIVPLNRKSLPFINRRDFYFLNINRANAISYDPERKIITLTIDDPSNELFIKDIRRRLKKYQLRFILVV